MPKSKCTTSPRSMTVLSGETVRKPGKCHFSLLEAARGGQVETTCRRDSPGVGHRASVARRRRSSCPHGLLDSTVPGERERRSTAPWLRRCQTLPGCIGAHLLGEEIIAIVGEAALH